MRELDDLARDATPWEPHDYIREFKDFARQRVRSRWANQAQATSAHRDLDDFLSIAYFELVRLANRFPDWIDPERLGGAPEKIVFFNQLNQEIDWTIAEYLSHRYSTTPPGRLDRKSDDDEDDGPDALEAARSRYRPPSMLLNEIVDYLSLMPLKNKVFAALRFFEEMPLDQIAELVEMSRESVTNQITRFSQQMREFALSRVLENPDPVPHYRYNKWEPPQRLLDWAEQYGDDLQGYVGYVTICFRVDVSYMQDIIERSYGRNGSFASFGGRGPRETANTKIPLSERPKILERLARGETQVALADEYGVSKGTIGYLHRTYGAVA